jgi:hypothetical protein
MSIFVVVLLAALGLSHPAAAETFLAQPLPDAHDTAPGDGVCADARGVCPLRAAVEEANALLGADTINLVAAKYHMGLGEMLVSEDLTIVGVGFDTTVDMHRLGRAFLVENPLVSLTINNVALVNGETPEVGGLISNSGILELTDCLLKGGRALRGSGVYNSGTMTLRRVGLIRHTDSPPAGLGGAIANSGTAILDSVSVIKGQARLGCGGGIYNTGNITATNLYVVRNRARRGYAGGICNVGGVIDCTNCLVARNQGHELTGGIRNDGVMRFWNSVISDNYFRRGTFGRLHDPNCSGTPPVSRGYNVEDRDSCSLNQTSDLIGIRVKLRGPSPVRDSYLYAGRPRGN